MTSAHVPQALASMASGKLPSEREQEIHTPPELLAPVHAVFGGQIILDPCAASDPAKWFARYNVTLPHDGKAIPWCSCTFWNPEYRDQAAWMIKARSEYLERGVQSIGLAKVVTNRRYFWPALRGGCEVIYLAPPTFLNKDGTRCCDAKGTRAAAPFALGFFCWGVTLPCLGKMELHREVVL